MSVYEFYSWRPADDEREERVCAGFGAATLLWLQERGELSSEWNACGTIADFLTFLLSEGDAHYCVSDQMAHSFGYATTRRRWQTVRRARRRAMQHQFQDFESRVHALRLPPIVASGEQVGELRRSIGDSAQSNATIFVPIGDLQASLLNVLQPKSAGKSQETRRRAETSAPIFSFAHWNVGAARVFAACCRRSIVVLVNADGRHSRSIFRRRRAARRRGLVEWRLRFCAASRGKRA